MDIYSTLINGNLFDNQHNNDEKCKWCDYINNFEIFFNDYIEKLITNENIFNLFSYLKFYYKDCLREHIKQNSAELIKNVYEFYNTNNDFVNFIKKLEDEKIKYLALNNKINSNFLRYLIEIKNENFNTNLIKLKFKYDE